jgi:hypothetical protein
MNRTRGIQNIIEARKKWKDSLLSGNLYGVLNCYNKNEHTFKGTTNNRVTSSEYDLKIYFTNFLTRNPLSVTFTKSDIIYVNYSFFDSGTYAFHFEKGNPIYANYQFVYKMIGGEPKIISHFSSEI